LEKASYSILSIVWNYQQRSLLRLRPLAWHMPGCCSSGSRWSWLCLFLARARQVCVTIHSMRGAIRIMDISHFPDTASIHKLLSTHCSWMQCTQPWCC